MLAARTGVVGKKGGYLSFQVLRIGLLYLLKEGKAFKETVAPFVDSILMDGNLIRNLQIIPSLGAEEEYFCPLDLTYRKSPTL